MRPVTSLIDVRKARSRGIANGERDVARLLRPAEVAGTGRATAPTQTDTLDCLVWCSTGGGIVQSRCGHPEGPRRCATAQALPRAA